jgi:hypothetical protein
MQNSQRNENTSTTSSAAFTDLIAEENTLSPKTRSRRKTLEKDEKRLDAIIDLKMPNNTPRSRMWIRTTAFLLFLGFVILFFVPEEKFNFKSDRKFIIKFISSFNN